MDLRIINNVTAVIPAYNEERTIFRIVSDAKRYVAHVIVVDDGSSDRTAIFADMAGANVIKHNFNMGYLNALRTGFHNTTTDFVVTLDADGEHNPSYIPKLTLPLLIKSADVVYGKRGSFRDWSEWFISKIVKPITGITDTSTGFRAIRTSLTKRMNFYGYCTCGTFSLEAKSLGARQIEIDVPYKIRLDRRIEPNHFKQIIFLISWVLKIKLFSKKHSLMERRHHLR